MDDDTGERDMTSVSTPPFTYVTLKLGFQSRHIIVRNRQESRHEGSKTGLGRGIIGGRHGRQGASPKVVFRKNDARLAVRNSLDVVAPSPGEFNGRFSAFNARIHGQDSVVSKVLGDKGGIFAEGIIVKGPAGEGEFLGLIDQGLDDFGMAMTLIHGRVRRKELVERE